MKMRTACCAMVLAAMIVAVGSVHAQSNDTLTSPSSGPGFRPFAISGEIGAYGELYGMSGRDARRPASIGRLFFRPTLTLFDALALNFDVLVSTEGTHARQDINQFGLNPSWSWGQAHVGDFTDEYAQFTLNGVRIRGGGFFINPGLFRFGAVGGVTRRAVQGTADNGAYDRYIYGGRLGIGRSEESFFDLVFLRARDKASSLDAPVAPTVFDSTTGTNAVPPYEVTPQENLVGGVISRLAFFDSQLTWDLEATGSLHTRDMRVDQDKQLNLPDWVDDLYHVNLTSSAGLAVRTDVGLAAGDFSLKTGYRYVSPAYTSLGVATLMNDWQEFSLAPALRIGRVMVSLTTMRQNDNLLGQKLNTLVRWQHGGNVSFQPTDRMSGMVMANYLSMDNDAANDTLRVTYSSLTLGTNQFMMFPEDAPIQSITFTYLYQQAVSESRIHAESRFSSHALNTGITIPLSTSLSLMPSAGLVVSLVAQQPSQTTQTYTVTLQHRALENALVSSLSGVVSAVGSATTFRSLLSSTLRVTSSASIALNLSMMQYRSNSPYGGNFTEYIASVYFTQRF